MLWEEKTIVWQSDTRYWSQNVETGTIKAIVNRMRPLLLPTMQSQGRMLDINLKAEALYCASHSEEVWCHKVTVPQASKLPAKVMAPGPEQAGLQTTNKAICLGSSNSSTKKKKDIYIQRCLLPSLEN